VAGAEYLIDYIKDNTSTFNKQQGLRLFILLALF